jgi:hypothetical protein
VDQTLIRHLLDSIPYKKSTWSCRRDTLVNGISHGPGQYGPRAALGRRNGRFCSCCSASPPATEAQEALGIFSLLIALLLLFAL